MSKKDLFELCYQSDKEKKLKHTLLNNIEESGFNKALKSFTFRNMITLSKCDIDDTLFFNILAKNYILYYYSVNKNIDLSIIDKFNKSILNNDFNEAYNIYTNNSIVHELLCIIYMKNLDKSLKEKIDLVDSRRFNEVLNKINLLNSTVLEDTKKNVKTKTYQKISNR